MADPRRLIDDAGGSALGRSLIASARADAPSPDGRARAARRLGVAAVLVAGAGAGTEGAALAAAWKLAAVLLALGGAVGLAVWQSPAEPPADRVAVRAAPSQPPPDRVAAVAPVAVTPPAVTPSVPDAPPATPSVPDAPPVVPDAPPALAPPAPRAPSTKRVAPAHPVRVVAPPPAVVAPAVVVEPVDPPAPIVDPASAVVAPEVEPIPPPVVAPPVVAPPPAAPAITGPSRLAAEVALLDRARTQLGAGNFAAATAAIAEYHQRFPSGDLDAEADLVTIETSIAAHQLAQARSLGTAFLARFPRSPLAQRVHSLIDRLPSPVRPPN